MNKERLEEIERLRGIDRRLIAFDHTDWLIKQAKRVQELEKYYISEKRLKELLNGNEDIGELYQFVEDNQKIEDVISMIIKEMGYLAGALDDYNKGFFELEKQNKRYRGALEFYADKENYKPFDGIFLSSYQNKVDEDGGEIARRALKGGYEW